MLIIKPTYNLSYVRIVSWVLVMIVLVDAAFIAPLTVKIIPNKRIIAGIGFPAENNFFSFSKFGPIHIEGLRIYLFWSVT